MSNVDLTKKVLVDPFDVSAQTVVVLGGSRGIGAACGLQLAAGGAHVELIGRDIAALQAVRSSIDDLGRGRARVTVLDVGDTDALAAHLASTHTYTSLVNSVGINRPTDLRDTIDEDIDAMVHLNLRVAIAAMRAALRRFTADGLAGSVVTISSQMGHVGARNRSVYCATKHAVEGLTRSVAVEAAPYGVRVNSVATTFVETAMTRPFLEDPVFRSDVLSRIPLGRMATADEVANAVRFLVSPAASMITGSSILVDGGWTAQ